MKQIRVLILLVLTVVCLNLFTGCATMNTINPHLDAISAQDVKEIRILSKHYGVEPGRLNRINLVNEQTAISRLLEEWKKTVTTFVLFNPPKGGGGGTVTCFYLNDGTTLRIVVSNGIYDGRYKIKNVPKALSSEIAKNLYSYNTYSNEGQIYSYKTNEKIADFDNVSGLHFEKYDKEIEELPEPLYYMQVMAGKFVIYGETLFSIDELSETNTQLYNLDCGITFYDIINKN